MNTNGMMETISEIGIFVLFYKHVVICAEVTVRDYWYEIIFLFVNSMP